MGQKYNFGFASSLLADLAGVTNYDLHVNVDAMLAAAEAIVPVARRLGVGPPAPHMYGMGYVHVSTLGARVVIGRQYPEPWVEPSLKRPEDIDRLAEPADYLAAGLVPGRLALVEQLRARRPDASIHIGHDFEGPATTAGLMLGQAFFLLPHDDPRRAHRLMEFVTRSAIHYTRAIRARQGRPFGGQHEGMCDDFAGIFPPEQFREFVVPYWNMLYEGLGASGRSLHSELLRQEHLPFLADLRIESFDPSVDQYLPADVLARSCPVPYGLRIWPAWVQSQSARQLVERYRYYAGFGTQYIMFYMDRLADEEKIAALLAVARELA